MHAALGEACCLPPSTRHSCERCVQRPASHGNVRGRDGRARGRASLTCCVAGAARGTRRAPILVGPKEPQDGEDEPVKDVEAPDVDALHAHRGRHHPHRRRASVLQRRIRAHIHGGAVAVCRCAACRSASAPPLATATRDKRGPCIAHAGASSIIPSATTTTTAAAAAGGATPPAGRARRAALPMPQAGACPAGHYPHLITGAPRNALGAWRASPLTVPCCVMLTVEHLALARVQDSACHAAQAAPRLSLAPAW